jgi:hypothetical protein
VEREASSANDPHLAFAPPPPSYFLGGVAAIPLLAVPRLCPNIRRK